MWVVIMQYTLNLTILYVNYTSMKLKENTLLKGLKEKKERNIISNSFICIWSSKEENKETVYGHCFVTIP